MEIIIDNGRSGTGRFLTSVGLSWTTSNFRLAGGQWTLKLAL
jgi:hypothetical protein